MKPRITRQAFPNQTDALCQASSIAAKHHLPMVRPNRGVPVEATGKPAKRGPEWVSKTNIADYYRCPYAFWLMDSAVMRRISAA